MAAARGQPPPRVTEQSNPLTAALDTADTAGLLRLLAGCDAQLFTGSAGLPALYDGATTAAAVRLSLAVRDALRHPKGRVVLAGCGTSGRLAQLLARDLNDWLSRRKRAASAPAAAVEAKRFGYLLAGGDGALLVPAEAVEDAPEAGRADLEAWCGREGVGPGADKEDAAGRAAPVVLVGVSCGLSATYIASMLSAAIDHGLTACAVGFNAVDAVADVQAPGWQGHSFHALLKRLLLPGSRGILINPVIGPEAVAGSSRMKGGSATSILLASALQLGCRLAATLTPAPAVVSPPPSPGGKAAPPVPLPSPTPEVGGDAASSALLAALLRGALAQHELAVRALYACASDGVAQIVDSAASSLTTPVAAATAAAVAAAAASSAAVLAAAPNAASAALAAAASASIPRVSQTGFGRLLYIGAGHAGLLGLVDASEATDTYGSRFNEVRAFTVGGWAAMAVADARSSAAPLLIPPELRRLSANSGGPFYQLPSEVANPGLGSFLADFVPTLSAADTVVLLHLAEGSGSGASAIDGALLRAAEAASKRGAAVLHAIVIAAGLSDFEGVPADMLAAVTAVGSRGGVLLRLPSLGLSFDSASALPPFMPTSGPGSARAGADTAAGAAVTQALAAAARSLPAPPSSLGSLALKLVLNAVTTGAFVARGAVIGNRMANMLLTNQKLLLRAVGIVAEVGGVPPAAARRAILRAAYSLDDAAALDLLEADERADARAVEAHVARASVAESVIPVALLLALSPPGLALTVEAARRLLARQPAVRRAVAEARAEAEAAAAARAAQAQ